MAAKVQVVSPREFTISDFAETKEMSSVYGSNIRTNFSTKLNLKSPTAQSLPNGLPTKPKTAQGRRKINIEVGILNSPREEKETPKLTQTTHTNTLTALSPEQLNV